jgi:dolichol-phosphate mannosyltransferase
VPELSVVVPVYGCAKTLPELHERLTRTLAPLVETYEIVLVDDRSPDGAWSTLAQLARSDPHTRAVRLSRNFGQHPAITAGLSLARGDRVVVMDCDLQDPPEEIPRLLEKAREGYEIVLAKRAGRQHPLLRRLAARVYFRLLSATSEARIDPAHGTFSIISRKVVDAYVRFQDKDRHYLFILYWLGFDAASIEYEHAARAEGRSGYGLRTLLTHAIGGLFFQTTVLLRWILYLGFVISALGLALAFYFLVAKATGSGYPGWTSLAVFTLTIGGFVIVSTGVTGLYVGKVFEQVKGRPLFVVDEIVESPPQA